MAIRGYFLIHFNLFMFDMLWYIIQFYLFYNEEDQTMDLKMNQT